MDMSGMSTTMDMSGTSTTMAMSASTPVDTSPPYTITALPNVKNQTSCVFNCLIPIGLADSSGCDDVTENCACLSAPVDAESFFSTCIQTVCKSSTAAYIASATSLYENYCLSIYGSASLEAATTANILADASAAAPSSTSASSSSASATAKSAASGGRERVGLLWHVALVAGRDRLRLLDLAIEANFDLNFHVLKR
ncbi:uncharacterized protein LY89DRAFT_715524 [Mollisia scopiformis]|uniref:Uncharacterized protein n=1 Tax=Mollisia scopiformis TaxID=149040 RepID=A0A194XM98_MOLSC|nr:uncharacterized protein LY89DRAFT_715524 [Mollisia scopiformis]KUJ21303.1 hypothetical protein LY89DRAFT_715524 [Mollisia scopiformis]